MKKEEKEEKNAKNNEDKTPLAFALASKQWRILRKKQEKEEKERIRKRRKNEFSWSVVFCFFFSFF